jgi:hypothetical protein
VPAKDHHIRNIQTIYGAKRIDSAILQCSPASVQEKGLGFDQCNIAAVVGDSEAAPVSGANFTPEQVLLANTQNAIILSSKNNSYSIDESTIDDCSRYFIALDVEQDIVDAQLSHDNKVVKLDGPQSIAVEGKDGKLAFIRNPEIGDAVSKDVLEDVMYAVAITHAVGIGHEDIETGLRQFFRTGD